MSEEHKTSQYKKITHDICLQFTNNDSNFHLNALTGGQTTSDTYFTHQPCNWQFFQAEPSQASAKALLAGLASLDFPQSSHPQPQNITIDITEHYRLVENCL